MTIAVRSLAGQRGNPGAQRHEQALALLPPDQGELRRLALAAAVVVALHGGVLGGYLLLGANEPEGAAESPAILIDLAPVPVAPSSPNDLAPGPEMVEALPTPKPQEIKEELPDPVDKVDAPAEVALPEPEKKIEEKREQQDTPAPQTTAAPRSDHPTAVAPAAPSPGSSAGRAMAQWRDLLMARLQQNKRYPASAESRHEQGIVTLSFSVDRNGKVLAKSIAKSSGVTALDEEVLAMVMRAQPLPAFPSAMPQPVLHLTVPIRFSLK